MRDDLDKQANELMEKKLATMLSPIEWQHVISYDEKRGFIFLGGNKANAATLQMLKQEAELISTMELWKILIETPNALGQQTMFRTGEDPDAFKKGRALIFHLDSQKKIVDILKTYTQPVKPNMWVDMAGV